MYEIIRVNYDSDRPTVLARELHEFLEVQTPYHKWFPRMCEYGFVENVDYAVTDNFVHNSAGGPQHQQDAQLTIEMAKESVCCNATSAANRHASILSSWKKIGTAPKR